ncbi:PAS-domain containing protein [uncultured Methylobacterium sp.]|uniref:PAS-domain containing protein n=1 Tax=uncultured Methylobacterium sp. TaxID=157278 RepID=UPI0035C99DE9
MRSTSIPWRSDRPEVALASFSETGLLLKALSAMQDSIAEKFGFIQRLVAQQASSYDVEIASQNARFETAFDHMTLGLRMYDAEDRLVVQNRRFSDMFDAEEATACLAAEAAVPGSYRRLLADGRTIEVSEEGMEG